MKFNHVALSLPAEALDAAGRDAIAEFYGDVFGFEPYDELTKDREQFVLRVEGIEQFVFLVSEDQPMQAPKGDHFGLSVSSVEEFEEVVRKVEAWQERLPDEVEVEGPMSEVFVDALRLHSVYIRYRLPLKVEVQHFELLV